MIGAFLWRMRGRTGEPWTIVFGLYMAALLYPIFELHSLWFALWIFLGEKPGWRAPLQAIRGRVWKDQGPEWWQKGILIKYPWLATVVRGFMIGGVGAIALPLGQWIQIVFGPHKDFSSGYWKWQEIYTGAVFELIVLLITISGIMIWH